MFLLSRNLWPTKSHRDAVSGLWPLPWSGGPFPASFWSLPWCPGTKGGHTLLFPQSKICLCHLEKWCHKCKFSRVASWAVWPTAWSTSASWIFLSKILQCQHLLSKCQLLEHLLPSLAWLLSLSLLLSYSSSSWHCPFSSWPFSSSPALLSKIPALGLGCSMSALVFSWEKKLLGKLACCPPLLSKGGCCFFPFLSKGSALWIVVCQSSLASHCYSHCNHSPPSSAFWGVQHLAPLGSWLFLASLWSWLFPPLAEAASTQLLSIWMLLPWGLCQQAFSGGTAAHLPFLLSFLSKQHHSISNHWVFHPLAGWKRLPFSNKTGGFHRWVPIQPIPWSMAKAWSNLWDHILGFWKSSHKCPCCPVSWSCWKILSSTALGQLEAWMCACTHLCSCFLFCQKEKQLEDVHPPFVKGDAGKTWVLAFSFSQRKSSPYQISWDSWTTAYMLCLMTQKTQTCKSIWKSIFYSNDFSAKQKTASILKKSIQKQEININKQNMVYID